MHQSLTSDLHQKPLATPLSISTAGWLTYPCNQILLDIYSTNSRHRRRRQTHGLVRWVGFAKCISHSCLDLGFLGLTCGSFSQTEGYLSGTMPAKKILGIFLSSYLIWKRDLDYFLLHRFRTPESFGLIFPSVFIPFGLLMFGLVLVYEKPTDSEHMQQGSKGKCDVNRCE